MKDGGAGLEPWQPLAVYSRAPFAPVTGGRMFDYATGKWAPARFHNYVTGEWVEGKTAQALRFRWAHGTRCWDAPMCRLRARVGASKSRNMAAQSGAERAGFHGLSPVGCGAWGQQARTAARGTRSLFQNAKVNIDTSIEGLARLAGSAPPAWLADALGNIQSGLDAFTSDCKNETGVDAAHKLVPIYRETLDLYARVKASDLSAEAKAGLELELGEKIAQFQTALKDLLGLDLVAFAPGDGGQGGGGRGDSAGETARSVWPGEDFGVRVHLAKALDDARLNRVWLESNDGSPWKIEDAGGARGAQAVTEPVSDRIFHVLAASGAQPTEPYFTRPTTEQPDYDISNRPGASARSRRIRSPRGRSSRLTACLFGLGRWCRRWRASPEWVACTSRWW